MPSINVKAKGQRAEHAVIALLTPIVREIYEKYGYPDVPKLKRNLEQVRGGGFDIAGVEWMALEVKHRETLALKEWWVQTLRQCGEGQEPILIYKQNNVKWRVMMNGYLVCRPPSIAGAQTNTGANHPPARLTCPVDISLDSFLQWFRHRLAWQLSLGASV